MKYAIVIAVVLGLVIFGTSNSFATTSSGDPIYMNYGTIKGDVTAAGHEGSIELNSFQWGVSRGISSPTGGSADREASAPSVSELVVTKTMDKASPLLVQQALGGTGQTVTIDLVTSSGFTYATYTLENVLISGYSVSSGGDRPTESISLSFTKILFKFNVQNSDGTIGTSPPQVGWDLALARLA